MTSSVPSQQAGSHTMEQVLDQAVACHQAGQLQDAERLYRDILQAQPGNPDANHNLGLLAVQMKQSAASLPYFLAALKANPAYDQYWLSYIDALIQADQVEVARQMLELAQRHGLQGGEIDALAARLDGMAQVAEQTNEESQYAYEESLQVSSIDSPINKKEFKNISAKSAISNTHKKNTPSQQEIDALLTLCNQERYIEAATLAQMMTVRYPLHGAGWKLLGAVFKQMGRSADALIPMQKAAALTPSDAGAHCNLGATLHALGRLDEAEACYRRALQINPDYAMAYSNLGFTLKEMQRLDEAEASCRRALQIEPDLAAAFCNLGYILKDMLLLVEAEESSRRALLINPDFAEAHLNLGNILQERGRLNEAEESYRRALSIKPDFPLAFGNMLFCLSNNGDWEAQALFAEHVRFGEQFEAPLRADWPQHSNIPDPERVLRIGIVSGDLHNHPVANFLEPVLIYLSRYPQLSLHAYSTNFIEDHITQRMRGNFAHWHGVVGLGDVDLAEKIRADGIDILIDLSGHTANNRLLTFARKPAPVQASWIGYPGTTGLQAMDYYLADRFLLPPGQMDDQFTEKIARLPANAPFLPSQIAPLSNALPALSNGYVTFGSFNRLIKLNPSVIALWAELLRALPASRMFLGGMPADGPSNALIEWFAQEGIERERLIFHGHCGMETYLTLHHQVDFCLDTFPYNGGTTTLYALLMGVPTLTLLGDTMPGRVGACVLGHAGLDDFMARDKGEFVEKGLYWARNPQFLAEVRVGLQERFEQSAMRRPELIAAGLERALRTMWQRWCGGLPPESFEAILQDEVNAMREIGQ